MTSFICLCWYFSVAKFRIHLLAPVRFCLQLGMNIHVSWRLLKSLKVKEIASTAYNPRTTGYNRFKIHMLLQTQTVVFTQVLMWLRKPNHWAYHSKMPTSFTTEKKKHGIKSEKNSPLNAEAGLQVWNSKSRRRIRSWLNMQGNYPCYEKNPGVHFWQV